MKPTNIIYYAVALIFPILFFTVLTNNSNERHPGAVWAMCLILMAGAGYFTSKGFPLKSVLKWVGISLIVGAAEAFLLTVVV